MLITQALISRNQPVEYNTQPGNKFNALEIKSWLSQSHLFAYWYKEGIISICRVTYGMEEAPTD